MTTLSFDTLKLARRLENAGFSSKQAGDTAEALAESLRETADLATRHDLVGLRAEVKGDIAGVKAELVELRAEMKGDIAGVKGDIAGVNADIADLRSEFYRALWLQAAGIVGVLSAVGALLKVLA